jgi:hypothetical protein
MKTFKVKVVFDHNEAGVIFEIEAETKIKAYSKIINKYRLKEILKISLI